MARAETGPGFELKHRITGAVILIGLGVIVLPLLLGGPVATQSEQRGDQNDSSPENTQVFISKITPIGGATPSAPEAVPPPTDVQPSSKKTPSATAIPAEPLPPPNEATATKSSAAKPQVKAPRADKPEQPAPPPKPAAKPPAKPRQTATAGPLLERGWVVQIGTFRKAENAKGAMVTLRQRGFKPSATTVETKLGAATRVWVGPYAQRVEAARVRARIERIIGAKGLIVAYP